MPIEIVADRTGNEISVADEFIANGHGSLTVTGAGNRVIIGAAATVGHMVLTVAGGADLFIGQDCVFLGGIQVHAGVAGSRVSIGARTAFVGFSIITAHEKATVEIGEDCLIAADCTFMSSDVHKVFDQRSGVRINPPGDIVIADRVWIAGRCQILKRTTVGSDSVVGVASVVRGQFGPGSMIAGVPAKVVRDGIRWEQ